MLESFMENHMKFMYICLFKDNLKEYKLHPIESLF